MKRLKAFPCFLSFLPFIFPRYRSGVRSRSKLFSHVPSMFQYPGRISEIVFNRWDRDNQRVTEDLCIDTGRLEPFHLGLWHLLFPTVPSTYPSLERVGCFVLGQQHLINRRVGNIFSCLTYSIDSLARWWKFLRWKSDNRICFGKKSCSVDKCTGQKTSTPVTERMPKQFTVDSIGFYRDARVLARDETKAAYIFLFPFCSAKNWNNCNENRKFRRVVTTVADFYLNPTRYGRSLGRWKKNTGFSNGKTVIVS